MQTASHKTIRIGCSGWNYDHWRGRFYPEEAPPKQWFEFYAGAFDTVEINNTFYQLPAAQTFKAWREQAPDGFIYAVKANRYLTHMKRLKDAKAPLKRFLDRARLLREHLGPILYQLPPRWRLNLERLELSWTCCLKDCGTSSNSVIKAGWPTRFFNCWRNAAPPSARTTCPG